MTNPSVARDPGGTRTAPEGAVEDIYNRRVRRALDEYRAFTREAYARAVRAESDEAA